RAADRLRGDDARRGRRSDVDERDARLAVGDDDSVAAAGHAATHASGGDEAEKRRRLRIGEIDHRQVARGAGHAVAFVQRGADDRAAEAVEVRDVEAADLYDVVDVAAVHDDDVPAAAGRGVRSHAD